MEANQKFHQKNGLLLWLNFTMTLCLFSSVCLSVSVVSELALDVANKVDLFISTHSNGFSFNLRICIKIC